MYSQPHLEARRRTNPESPQFRTRTCRLPGTERSMLPWVPNGKAFLAAAMAAGSSPVRMARHCARSPFEFQAMRRISRLRAYELNDFVSDTREIEFRFPASKSRHEWSLGVSEQLVLQTIIREHGASTAFEIGTFNGGTTRILAETLPKAERSGRSTSRKSRSTPPQSPQAFRGEIVGEAYTDSSHRQKIEQLFGDSLSFDFQPFRNTSDIVLVDGGHEYKHGYSDSRTALSIVREGGFILWDDFQPYWYGLVDGVCDAMVRVLT